MDAEHKKEYWQRMLSNLVLLLAVSLSLFLFGGCTMAESQTEHDATQVIRIATDYREEDLGYLQLQSFAQTVFEKSAGTMMVQLYKKDEWSTAERFVDYLNIDALEMACLPMSQAITLQPMYEIYEQPYLFSGLQAVEAYLSGSAMQKALQHLPEAYHGVGLVADGYSYWVQGASARMMSYGAVKHLAEIHELKNTYVYDVQAIYRLHPLVASGTWWTTLSEQQQTCIVDSFQESIKSILIHQKEIAPKRLAESGADVYSILPVEQAGITGQWMNQRETYFLLHSDALTIYWRPTVITIVSGKET